MSDEEVSTIKRDLIVDLIFDALILFLIIYFGRDASCGIPIFMWTIVYFVILGCRSLSNLVKIFLIRASSSIINRYSIISFVIIDGCLLAWLIYGNVIFYSDENNCKVIENSKALYNVMLVLIIIGYFQMVVYGLIIFCLPCILYALQNQ